MQLLDVITSQIFNQFIKSVEGNGVYHMEVTQTENTLDVNVRYMFHGKIFNKSSTISLIPNTFDDYLFESLMISDLGVYVKLGESSTFSGYVRTAGAALSPLPRVEEDEVTVCNYLFQPNSTIPISSVSISNCPILSLNNLIVHSEHSNYKSLIGVSGRVLKELYIQNAPFHFSGFYIQNNLDGGETLSITESIYSVPYDGLRIWIKGGIVNFNITEYEARVVGTPGDYVNRINYIKTGNISYRENALNCHNVIIVDNNIYLPLEAEEEYDVYVNEACINQEGIAGISCDNVVERETTEEYKCCFNQRNCGTYIGFSYISVNNIGVNVGIAFGNYENNLTNSIALFAHNVFKGSIAATIDVDTGATIDRYEKNILIGKLQNGAIPNVNSNIVNYKITATGKRITLNCPRTVIPAESTILLHQFTFPPMGLDIGLCSIFSENNSGELRIITHTDTISYYANTFSSEWTYYPRSIRETLSVYLINTLTVSNTLSAILVLNTTRPQGEYS